MSLLEPKKTKYRKMQKGRSRKVASRGNRIAFGSFGLKSLDSKWVSSAQLEAGRRAISRIIKGKGEIWTRIFPDKPITTKGVEFPMGGGKGDVDHYVFPVEQGRIIFEVDGIPEETAREALKRASAKLAVRTKFIKR